MELYIKGNVSARHKTFAPQILVHPPILMAEAGPQIFLAEHKLSVRTYPSPLDIFKEQ